MDVTIPEIAENVDTAEVARILVSEGDDVAQDQPLLELEADKASFELPSPIDGRVDGIHVSEGDEVSVGQKAISVAEGDGEEKAKKKKKKEDGEKTAKAKKSDGEKTAKAKKSDSEKKKKKSDGEKTAKAKKSDSEKKKKKGDGEKKDESEAPPRDASDLLPRAAPTTRKLARELGVELARVPAGSDGRVTKDAVKAFVREHATLEESGVERRRLSRLRRTAAERLTKAWRTIPHVTQHEVVDVTELVAARRRYEETRREAEPKLTMGALVAHATVAALSEHDTFNAHYDEEETEVVVFSEVHLGVAVDTPRGLVVPVVRNAGRSRLFDLAERMAQAAEAAREGSLDAGDMRGATFTVTNLGGLGGSFFTPIINPPEVAILGVGRARRGVYDGGTSGTWQLPLSLSYDHRVVDGADAVRFLRAVARRLREPLALAG